MIDGPFKPAELARYAAAICDGTAVAPGDRIVVSAEIVHRPLAIALAGEIFRRGALAEVLYSDPFETHARLTSGNEAAYGVRPPWLMQALNVHGPGHALIAISGSEEPTLLASVDPTVLSTDLAGYSRLRAPRTRDLQAGRVRFTVVAYPTAVWAQSVYPKLDAAGAQRRLAKDLLAFCRVAKRDGAETWQDHVATLERRAAVLTRTGIDALELVGPGTELTVALPPDALWIGGAMTFAGRRGTPNMPTEEVFTSPDPRGTNGVFSCTRALGFKGRVIEGIQGEFVSGRLAALGAKRKSDRRLLEQYLASDPGAGRLGEIALVAESESRIAKAGRSYNNTLLDENAASHMALGAGFAWARKPAPAGARASAPNRSSVHLDIMIGSPEVTVSARTRRGRTTTLLEGGAWRPAGLR